MENKAEHIKQKLIGLADGKMGDSYIEKKTINEGFKLAVKNGDGETVKQALECRLISNVHFGHVLNKAVLENDRGALELVMVKTSEDAYYNGKKRVFKKAAETGNLDIIKWLAETGMEVQDSKDAIALAMKNNHSDVLRYLITHGADIKERKNKTALMNFFISHNQGDIVRYLIERGYDIYRGNPTKWYGSLSVAASRGNLEIFKYLFEETGKNDKKCHKIKLFCGIYYGTVDIVKYVIDNMDVDDEKYVKRIMETYCLGNETNGEKTRYLMDSGILAE